MGSSNRWAYKAMRPFVYNRVNQTLAKKKTIEGLELAKSVISEIRSQHEIYEHYSSTSVDNHSPRKLDGLRALAELADRNMYNIIYCILDGHRGLKKDERLGKHGYRAK